MSNAGLWDEHYAGVEERRPYVNTETYKLGAEWLADCETVADFGCGLGWLRNFIPAERYVGIDGSHSRFADEVVDLAEHRGQYAGVFMRHVLEHNHEWAKVLDNALASFTERMALILFTPLAETTHNLGDEPGYPGVPCYSFKADDLLERFEAAGAYPAKPVEWIPGPVQRGGVETIFYLSKP